MPRTLSVLLLVLLSPSLAAQEFLADGRITSVTPTITASLHEPSDVPLGTPVFTFETIAVNGQAIGRRTGTFRVLRADSSSLVLSPENATSAYPDLQVGQEMQLLLSTPPGNVEVQSNPSAAQIIWRDQPMGETPLSFELAPGDYTFWLQAPGYELTPLPFRVDPNLIIGVSAPLVTSPTAEGLFREAQVLYRSYRFEDASAQLSRLGASGQEGTLSPESAAALPLLRRNVSEAQALAGRARSASLSEEMQRRVVDAYMLFRQVEGSGNWRAVRENVDAMHRLMPDDPLVRDIYAAHATNSRGE